MAKFRVGIIGCGRPRSEPGATGFGMAHFHAAGYEASPEAEIVAVADINPVNLKLFQQEHNVPRGYLSADEMFANEELDVVSICLWPHLHAPMTIKTAEAGVKAIHCEKPMALTYGEAKAMVEACQKNDVVLTFDHQRRFGGPFRKARELLKSGVIGQLERLEAYTSNLYDWGTHWFDMLFFYNDETPVEWVIGQLDARGGHPIFGVVVEGQGMSLFKYKNGVMGMMVTGPGDTLNSLNSAGCANRLIGSDGVIEVGVNNGPVVRMRGISTGGRWENVEVDGGLHGDNLFKLAVFDLLDALKTGREPELSARKALQATELIFASYESSRRRARIDLPLDVDDSPFIQMLTNCDVTTWSSDYVFANGIHMHYHRTGHGEKPPVVLCHGFSDNGLCWNPVARALENDYDVIMVDARGHGLTDAPAQGHDTETRADDVAAFVQALNLEKPAVLGHSMGAATAAAFAAKYPQLVGKALLEDPAWFDEGSRRQRMTPEERQAWAKQRLDGVLENKKMSRKALAEKCRQQSPHWSEEEIGPWSLAQQQLSPNVVSSPGGHPQPWTEVAKAIQCPTLLITGNVNKGAIVTPELAQKAMKINANIEVANIDAEHSIRREAFEAYIEVVKAFLAKD
jgi:UDP-N-acetylglucosamine 3-dehydrogenase